MLYTLMFTDMYFYSTGVETRCDSCYH